MRNFQQKQFLFAIGVIFAAVLTIWGVRAYRSGRLRRITNPAGGIAPAPGTFPAANLDYTRILGIGTKGPEVGELQRLLNRDGASPRLAVDNDFGPKTRAALLAARNVDEITLNQYGATSNNLTTANGLPGGTQNIITSNSGGITGGTQRPTMPGTLL